MATNDLKIDKIKAKINQELNALIDRAMRDRATGNARGSRHAGRPRSHRA